MINRRWLQQQLADNKKNLIFILITLERSQPIKPTKIGRPPTHNNRARLCVQSQNDYSLLAPCSKVQVVLNSSLTCTVVQTAINCIVPDDTTHSCTESSAGERGAHQSWRSIILEQDGINRRCWAHTRAQASVMGFGLTCGSGQ